MDGQNNLREFMVKHSKEFDVRWYEHITGRKLTEEQKMVFYYHSAGNIQIRLEWIMKGTHLTPEEKAEFSIRVRTESADELISDNEQKPWINVLKRIEECIK